MKLHGVHRHAANGTETHSGKTRQYNHHTALAVPARSSRDGRISQAQGESEEQG